MSDLVKHIREVEQLYKDAGIHGSEGARWAGLAADRIEELEAKLARSERHNEALEELRPVWAQGWTGDSQAAQVSSSALAQLWEMLGASNQTQAVEALAELRGDKE